MAKKKKQTKPKETRNFKQWLSVEEGNIYPIDFKGMLISILIFFIAFFSYLFTLTPGIGFHDSGDMIAASFLLGIPHPPGYPFYCLLGKLFSLIPLGNIAYRLNLMSALAASLTVMMTYLILLKTRLLYPLSQGRGNLSFLQKAKELFIQYIPLLAPALIFCWTKSFWEQAVVAEKYTLNALFATVLIYILLKWQEAINQATGKGIASALLYLFCFTLGLSFTHHLQTIFLVPAAAYLILIANWQRVKPYLKPGFLSKSALLFLLPLCLYLYLLIRAKAEPLANWGNPSNLSRLLEHITAQAYKGFFSMADLTKNLWTHTTQFFPDQFTTLLILIGLFGAFILFMKRKQMFIFLLIILLADIAHSIRYTIPNIEDYYIPGFLVFSIWIGYGLLGLREMINSLKPSLIPTFSFVFLALPVIPLSIHYSHSDRSDYYLAYDEAMTMLNQLEERAIVITKGDDDLFPIWYLQYIEGRRRDVAVFNMILFTHRWHMEQMKRMHPYLDLEFDPRALIHSQSQDGLDDTARTRLVSTVQRNYRSIPTYAYYINALSSSYCLVPEAILCRVLPKDTNNPIQYQHLEANKNWLKYRRGLLTKGIKDRRGLEIVKTYGMTYSNRGSTYLALGMTDKAMIEFEEGVKIDTSSADLHYNLGALYANAGRKQEAICQFEEALKAKPDHLNAKEALERLNSN